MKSLLPASQVEVVLSDCSAADAGNLFQALKGRFASDRDSGDEPHEVGQRRPTVWTGTFDMSRPVEHTGAPSAHLSAPVTIDVQGSPDAVRHLREALGECFTVHELGADSGDQEVEVQLRLERRA
jgi:hypothetical protein